ncbi:MAG: hypothetical protein QXX95_08530 [Nitrososphaerales archaeon]
MQEEECFSLETIKSELKEKGFNFEFNKSLKGKSNIEHKFDLVISDGSIVFDFISSQVPLDDIAVIRFFAKVFDVNAKKGVLVVKPRLRDSGKKLAKLYKIKTVEVENMSEKESIEAIMKLIT